MGETTLGELFKLEREDRPTYTDVVPGIEADHALTPPIVKGSVGAAQVSQEDHVVSKQVHAGVLSADLGIV